MTLTACATATPTSSPVAPALQGVARASITPFAFDEEPAVVEVENTAASSVMAPAEGETCAAAPDKGTHFGFYSSDSWDKGRVVLTFDDGPHPSHTPRVLDLLKERQMPATFFVVGRNISRDTYPLVQRMIAEGHTLGSHSYSHDVTMTKVAAPKETVEFIRGQHEATRILVDMALLARSSDDFDAMFQAVFARDPKVWLTGTIIKQEWRDYVARHRTLLDERGFAQGDRPYDLIYSRPPGGGPYVEHDGAAGKAIHDEALVRVGMMNVMFHGASGDTVPGQRSDFAFLTKNVEKYSEAGGVIVIHDYMRGDALASSLSKIDKDPAVSVMTLEQALARKYGCTPASMATRLTKDAAQRNHSHAAVASTTNATKVSAMAGRDADVGGASTPAD